MRTAKSRAGCASCGSPLPCPHAWTAVGGMDRRRPLFAPMHVFDSYKKALVHAIRVIRRLNKERIALERGLEDLTAEAAAVLEDD